MSTTLSRGMIMRRIITQKSPSKTLGKFGTDLGAIVVMMKRLVPAAAALAIAALISADAFAERFSSGETEMLVRGEVVRRERPQNGKDGLFGGTGYAMINASPAEIFATIQDWPVYPKVFSNVVESKLLAKRNGRCLVRMKIGHPVLSVTYHVEMTPDESSWTMKFHQVSGMANDLDDIYGYWRLFPVAENRTIVAYALNVQVPMGLVNLLPAPFKRMAITSLLGVPGYLREWMDKQPRREKP